MATDRTRTILSVTVLLLGVLLLAAGAAGLMGGSLLPANGEERITCTGTVQVRLGLDEQLENVECDIDACGLLFSIFDPLDVTEQSGKVQLVADNRVRASKAWSSNFGRDQDFSISGCVPEDSSVKLVVYDDEGKLQDTEEDLR